MDQDRKVGEKMETIKYVWVRMAGDNMAGERTAPPKT
jgi:hypothetical protein